MTKHSPLRALSGGCAAIALTLTLTACGGDDSEADRDGASDPTSAEAAEAAESEADDTTPDEVPEETEPAPPPPESAGSAVLTFDGQTYDATLTVCTAEDPGVPAPTFTVMGDVDSADMTFEIYEAQDFAALPDDKNTATSVQRMWFSNDDIGLTHVAEGEGATFAGDATGFTVEVDVEPGMGPAPLETAPFLEGGRLTIEATCSA